MTEDYSEQNLKNHCPHCDKNGWAFEFGLKEFEHFSVICDCHPLLEGHILIIPNRHVSCIGEYTQDEFSEFIRIYERMSHWISREYGAVATFEHGKIGQTVFHSHVHLLPVSANPEQIIPEGKAFFRPIESIENLIEIFQKENQYLFFSLGKEMWVVDASIGMPRFFRDRFASFIGKPERANWKETRRNPQLLDAGHAENKLCQQKFDKLY